MEIVDVYNSRKELTGETCERNNVPTSKFRLSIHVWIINSNGEILVQQRSSNRKMFPNMWTNTGGAALAGENSLETVIRELKEELNVIVNTEKLELIASYKRKNDFVDVWLLREDLDINEMKFQEDEVQDAKWVKIDEFLDMLNKKEAVKSSTDYFIKYINGEF